MGLLRVPAACNEQQQAKKTGELENSPVFSLFHWNGVLTRQANIQSKGQLIAKFTRAMVEAIHIYKRDKEATLKIISKYTQIRNPVVCECG